MNAVLADILTSQQVSDGTRSFPLRHPDYPDSLEVGCAYGVSSLFICESLSPQARHIVIDPFQSTQWRGIGPQEHPRSRIRLARRLSRGAI